MNFADFLLSPLIYTLLFGALLAWLWRRLPRAARCAGVVVEIVLLSAMAPVGANALVWAVESRTPSPHACGTPAPSTIVVLSGGTDRLPNSAEDFAALDESSLDRLFAGLALWRRTPGARLVIAGGGRPIAQSALMGGLAERMGVPASAIVTEQASSTTWENARNVAALSPPLPRRIWLVSSDLHLPRALMAFRAWGFQPCVWPSGSLHVPFGWSIGYFMPQTSSLHKADRAIHEIVGGLVYAWRARVNAAGRHAAAPYTKSAP